MIVVCSAPRWFNLLALLALLALSPISTVRAADITVDDDCLLEDAIVAANTDLPRGGCSAGDRADVIFLTDDVELKGMLPPVNSQITILGNGHTLRGAKRDRLLHVVSGELRIHDLTLTGGRREIEYGGAIRVESVASLQVFDSEFRDNVGRYGGAIASFGHLEIENTTFKQNEAKFDGGAVYTNGVDIIVAESAFESNVAGHGGGGIYILRGASDLQGGQFSGNEAGWGGGGLVAHEVTLTIKNSTFSNNHTESEGGAIDVSSSTVTITRTRMFNNSAWHDGGALKSWYDTISISDSVISGNTAGRKGGGIHSHATDFTLRASVISDNEGGNGGGIYADNGIHRIAGSNFSGNRANGNGGALLSEANRLFIHNSTFYGNRAAGSGGGLMLEGFTKLAHVTVAFNFASERGGMYVQGRNTRLVNSIIAGNLHQDCAGILIENINNMIADGSCEPMLEGDPLLAGIWGSPAVLVPAPDSPAIDAGDGSSCLASDQLDRHRVWGASCDLGALEVDPDQELSLEPLESIETREKEQDPVAGIIVDGDCSLAYAIESANLGWSVGGCPAGIDGVNTITLTADVTLQYSLPYITSDIIIEGKGHTVSGAQRHSIFNVSAAKLIINDLTITEGEAIGGGGIYSIDGTIILNRSKVIGNRSVGSILGDGGGIYCFPCTLIVRDSLIANNSTEQSGGGISWYGHGLDQDFHLEIHNSVITGNSAIHGGGLNITGSDSLEQSTITNTVISNNFAKYDGGGISASVGAGSSYFSISNVTVYANRAGRIGGGIFASGDVRLSHVTVAGNEAESGGGIYTQDEGGTRLRFSIIANNSGNDCVGYPVENKLSLIADGTCGTPLSGDPELLDLVEPADGSSAFFPLLPGSPAIDAVDCDESLPADQIGTPRPQGVRCDLGAIEFVPNTEG